MQTLPNGVKQFDPSDNANTANFNLALKSADDALGTKAPKDSPALTGTPSAPTAKTGTNTTQLATTAFVQAVMADKTETIRIDSTKKLITEVRTTDPVSPEIGRIWFRSDL